MSQGEPVVLTVEDTQAGARLDVFLAASLPDMSRSRLQALVRGGQVLVNGAEARPSLILRTGDAVGVTVPDAVAPVGVPAEDIPLHVLWEDEDLVVINKPAGLVVHPGAGNATGTVVNALLHHCKALSGIGGVSRPGIVHRLDKETSGCLVIAKNDAAHTSLSAQFAGRDIGKVYLALVEGTPRMPHGEITGSIARHPVHRQKFTVDERGREAFTHYRVLASSGSQSLLECRPKTGRTHQIRVHLKHLGHPVVGDPMYGRRGSHTRHFLHAWKLAFTHPATGRPAAFTAPLDADFPDWAHAAAVAREAAENSSPGRASVRSKAAR